MDEQLDEEFVALDALPHIEFEIGDNVVYPHHGAGQVIRKEVKDILGEQREYLTIKILHNDMTVMVPTEKAAVTGLRRVMDEETVKKVLALLSDEVSEMPKNWNRRFKHNRDKIKTGDIYELAEVVRNLAIREAAKGLSTGEKQMFTRAKKILCSELMYALEMDEEQVEVHIYELAEVVRNLAIREAAKGLSTGEKQMFTRAKKILCSELMYALEMDEEQVEVHIYELLGETAPASVRKVAVAAE